MQEYVEKQTRHNKLSQSEIVIEPLREISPLQKSLNDVSHKSATHVTSCSEEQILKNSNYQIILKQTLIFLLIENIFSTQTLKSEIYFWKIMKSYQACSGG